MRAFFFNLLCWILSLPVFSQIPAGYYDSAAGLSGLPLQTALHNIIDNHTPVDYSSLYTYFAITDIRPDTTVWDMYSDIPGGTPPYVYHYVSADECGGYTAEGDCFNREHSWPKSWFGGDILPMYTDLFQLYPTDGWVNNKRGNYPYGNVGTATWISLNGSKLGNCSWPGYSGVVFEPIDEYKGDFARSFFYMSVRYFGEDGAWPGSDMTTGAKLKPWAQSMLLQWNQDDTVSQKEIDRNNAIYLIQGNRNPFIDRPQFAQDIWGQGAGTEKNSTTAFTILPNPVYGKCKLILPQNRSGQEANILIYSIYGILVNDFKATPGSSADIDFSGIKPGVYFARMIINGKMQDSCRKIVVYHP